MMANDLNKCPRTKETQCQCESLHTINEAEETVKALVQFEHTEGDVQGIIKMKQAPGKPTIIRGLIKGLEPGEHGLHIHEFGDLSDGCASAGGHYNPDGVDHGPLEGGMKDAHVGDLGNIVANEKGEARFKIVARRVDLSGDRSVVGRAVVVHADRDDLGKGGDEESLKTGNAGERLGCGVIRLRQGIEENYQRHVSDKHFNRNQLPQIRKRDIKDSPFSFKQGTITLDKIKPVQSQRVDGLSKRAENMFFDGDYRPFIIDKKGYLVNGHHRFDAANILGIDRVKAIIVDADIEELMKHFSHKVSDQAVMDSLQNKLTTMLTSEDASNCKHGKYFCSTDKVWKCRKKPKKTRMSEALAEAEVINFPGTYVKRDYVNINGVKMLKDVWEYMSQEREEEHSIDSKGNKFKKGISNFTGDEHPVILKRAYQMELRNFIDEFENQDMDPQPFIDELEQIDENFADGKKKGKSRPGRVKRAGASCKGSVTSLRKKAKNSSGEKSKMYHWCANMKSGRKKS